jgi:HTH-type transcriptional regulator/antitoxin HigA
METLKYKIINSEKQYKKYCGILEELVFSTQKTKSDKEEIALLTLLIEKWDEEHNIFNELDPVELLVSLMKDHNMKSYQLADLLNVSEGSVSDMLHYRRGLSKNSIRILAQHFKLDQEAFNRPYKLKSENTSTRLKVQAVRKSKKRDYAHK